MACFLEIIVLRTRMESKTLYLVICSYKNDIFQVYALSEQASAKNTQEVT